jgi:hypothetical protein
VCWGYPGPRCGYAVALSGGDGKAEALCGSRGEIGRLRWILRQVCALADDAPTITDQQLRDRLLAGLVCPVTRLRWCIFSSPLHGAVHLRDAAAAR